jgi:hypothetical protein
MKYCELFDSLKKTWLLLKAYKELKADLAALSKEKRKLEEELKRLKDDKKNRLVFSSKDGLYYYAGDTAGKHPYCPACYESAEKRIRLPKSTLKCRACGNDFRGGKA